MNRSHLTPVPIVNKNGVLTTVYRKNDPSADADQRMPLPQMHHQKYWDKNKLTMSIAERVRELTVDGDVHEVDEGQVEETVSEYGMKTLERVNSFLAADSKSSRMIATKLVEGEVEEDLLNDAMVFFPEIESESDDPDYLMSFVDSLRRYSVDKAYDPDTGKHFSSVKGFNHAREFSEADDQTKRQCIALMRTAIALHRQSEKVSLSESPIEESFSVVSIHVLHLIKDKRIAELAVDRPDEIEPVLDAIDAGAYRFEQIEAVLRGDSASLSSGIL